MSATVSAPRQVPATTVTGHRDRRDRERELVKAARLGGPRDRERLIEEFMPLIANVARPYLAARCIERRELMQEGVVGLLRALDRYDVERGTPFWPYAKSWVRQAMQRLVAQLAHPIVLSDRALREFARIRNAREQCRERDGHDPTSEEVALEAGIPGDRVRGLVAAHHFAYGLDECFPDSRDQGTTIAERLADPAAEEDYEAVVLRLATERLPELLRHLDEFECSVVTARYGLGGKPLTLREVGADLDVSAERVRQIQQTALDKLRVGTGSA
jgi:RNA polymerase sigma factor (sigma-70 family)